MTILNVKEVAQLLHSDKRTIQRLASKGYYPAGVCGKHGRYWLFNKEKLEEFIFGCNYSQNAVSYNFSVI